MKAMIFAAGLGTRLRPLTNDRPKAMVEVNGMPLLEIAIRRLKFFGIHEIIINIHHFGQLILDFLDSKRHFDCSITISDERDLLLNTGGGLKKAREWLGDGPFIIHNVDILHNLDFHQMLHTHQASGAIATMAVRNRISSRYMLFDETRQLVGWRNAKTGETIHARPAEHYIDWAFSGLHIISPEFFDFMPDTPVFSIIDVYLEACKTATIAAYPHDNSIWLDMGKPATIAQAATLLSHIPLA